MRRLFIEYKRIPPSTEEAGTYMLSTMPQRALPQVQETQGASPTAPKSSVGRGEQINALGNANLRTDKEWQTVENPEPLKQGCFSQPIFLEDSPLEKKPGKNSHHPSQNPS